MWDDDEDKGLKRNQFIAVVLMTVLLFVWFQWFLPKPSPTEPVKGEASQVAPDSPPREASAITATAEAVRPSELEPGAFPLPPIPTALDPATDEFTLRNEHLQLVLTRIGARLKDATVILGQQGESSIQLIPITPDVPDTEAVYPMGLRFTSDFLGDQLDRRRWELEHSDEGSVTFRMTLPGLAVLRKTFSLQPGMHVFQVKVDYQSLESAPRLLGIDQTPAYALNWGPNVASHDELKGVQQAIFWHTPKENETLATAKMKPDDDKPFIKTVADTEWVALKSAYFVVALKSDFGPAQGVATGEHTAFRFGIAVPRVSVAPGETLSHAFDVYVGPSELSALKAAWPTLPQALQFFDTFKFMDWFAKLLLGLLNWFHYHLYINYGVAIVLLTVLVRGVMFPLTLKSMKSMKKMQLLGPEIKELQEKYKDDQQEISKRMMELYRERGVNPLGGCLPMLLQMPVFFALYRMLSSAFELRGAHFVFWINDLSQPDKLFHMFHQPWAQHFPLLGSIEYFNLLPILMGISMVVSQKFTPTSGPAMNPQQKAMMTFMPLFFSAVCYSMASGLSLYILTSTILGMAQQHFIHVSAGELAAKKKPKKKQHFYAAAQARKRQMIKDAKEEGRRMPPAKSKDPVPNPKRPEQPETK